MSQYIHLDALLKQQTNTNINQPMSPTAMLNSASLGSNNTNFNKLSVQLPVPLSLLSDSSTTSISANNSDYLSNKSSNRSSFTHQQHPQLPFLSSPTFAATNNLWENANSFSDDSLSNWNTHTTQQNLFQHIPQPQGNNEDLINYAYLNKLSLYQLSPKSSVSQQNQNQNQNQQQNFSSAQTLSSTTEKLETTSKQPINKSLFKTEMCDSFSKLGYCPYNSKCQFAHGETDLIRVQKNKNFKTKMCQNWLDLGYCKYGKRCCYKHGQLDIPH